MTSPSGILPCVDEPVDTADGLLSSDEVCAATGLTFRQLDYWTRIGIAHPTRHSTGSGIARRWHPDEAAVLRAARRLIHGLDIPPAGAVRLARRGPHTTTVALGTALVLTDALWEP